MLSTPGIEHADKWRYEGPRGDLAGAIATEGQGLGQEPRWEGTLRVTDSRNGW